MGRSEGAARLGGHPHADADARRRVLARTKAFVTAAALAGEPFFVRCASSRIGIYTHLRPGRETLTTAHSSELDVYGSGMIEHDLQVGDPLRTVVYYYNEADLSALRVANGKLVALPDPERVLRRQQAGRARLQPAGRPVREARRVEEHRRRDEARRRLGRAGAGRPGRPRRDPHGVPAPTEGRHPDATHGPVTRRVGT